MGRDHENSIRGKIDENGTDIYVKLCLKAVSNETKGGVRNKLKHWVLIWERGTGPSFPTLLSS